MRASYTGNSALGTGFVELTNKEAQTFAHSLWTDQQSRVAQVSSGLRNLGFHES